MISKVVKLLDLLIQRLIIKIKKIKWHLSVVFCLSIACATQNQQSLISDQKYDQSKEAQGISLDKTPNLSTNEVLLKASNLQIPANFLNMAHIIRPMAQVREGPGSQFKLKDNWLSQNEEVIVFNRFGAWQKIIAVNKLFSGWVHHKVLGAVIPNAKPITIPLDLLPTVFSVRLIRKGYLNPSLETVSLNIPKGRPFAAFQINERRSLVWLEDTNSVIWLGEQDAQ